VRQVPPLIGPCQIQRRALCLFSVVSVWGSEKGILAGCFSPIDPPIAIICRCLPFNLRARGEEAVRCAAASTSNTLPSTPRAAGLVIEAFGSRLKLSHIRFSNPSLRETKAPSSAKLGDLVEPLRLSFWSLFSISRMDGTWRSSLSGLCGGALSRTAVKAGVGQGSRYHR
jgi:hypothetical protein